MSRKRQLTSALNKQNEEKEAVEQGIEEEVQEEVTESQNEPILEVSEGNEGESTPITVKDEIEQFKSKYEQKTKKPTVEDTHTRTTFLFRNDLKKELDKLSKNKRGFKTEFINHAIETYLRNYR